MSKKNVLHCVNLMLEKKWDYEIKGKFGCLNEIGEDSIVIQSYKNGDVLTQLMLSNLVLDNLKESFKSASWINQYFYDNGIVLISNNFKIDIPYDLQIVISMNHISYEMIGILKNIIETSMNELINRECKNKCWFEKTTDDLISKWSDIIMDDDAIVFSKTFVFSTYIPKWYFENALYLSICDYRRLGQYIAEDVEIKLVGTVNSSYIIPTMGGGMMIRIDKITKNTHTDDRFDITIVNKINNPKIGEKEFKGIIDYINGYFGNMVEVVNTDVKFVSERFKQEEVTHGII